MAKKILFIDRDGTLTLEAPPGYQLDSFDKLIFYPYVFTFMHLIASKFNYELLMVTNQDGLGTDMFPENTFWPVHHFILKAFENEGVHFSNVFIDKTFPYQHINTRKPQTGMLTQYLNNPDYDIKESFVIGDRLTDMQLAQNLGCKGIWINNDEELGGSELTKMDVAALQNTISLKTKHWQEIYLFLKSENHYEH
ncbi:MAG: histidinol-phosphatase [Niastella sp.]|nr:histidinol-phosphatase [Niastella sp.]